MIPAPKGKAYLPYQEKAIKFMAGALPGTGTLLADEMGLGKTIEVIGFMNLVKPQRTLVVCPKSLTGNWFDEANAWGLHHQWGGYFCVTSYGLAHKHLDDTAPYDLLVFDEAHYVKNPTSKRSQLAKALWTRTKKHSLRPNLILATGTPIDVSPIDLWPLLQMVAPQEFDPPKTRNPLILSPEQRKSHPGEGPNFWEYAKRYCGAKVVMRPIDCIYTVRTDGAECDACGKPKYAHRFPVRYRGGWDFSNASNLDELQRRLRRTCMVRRLKAEVLTELPEKRRQIVRLDIKRADDSDLMNRLGFSDITLDNYDTFVSKLTADKVVFSEWAKRRHEQALAKVDDVIGYVDDVLDNGQKVILFAHHRDVIEKLVNGLCNFEPAIITGETHVADRQAAVKRFQNDPHCRLIIGSIGAMGVGYTLTESSHVIFAELSPSLRDMSQAEDRAHRIGARNMVLIQHLIVDGSLCARMAKILVKKQGVARAALDLVQTERGVTVSAANDCQAESEK